MKKDIQFLVSELKELRMTVIRVENAGRHYDYVESLKKQEKEIEIELKNLGFHNF